MNNTKFLAWKLLLSGKIWAHVFFSPEVKLQHFMFLLASSLLAIISI